MALGPPQACRPGPGAKPKVLRQVRLDWPGRMPLPPPTSPELRPILSLPGTGVGIGRLRLVRGQALAVADRLLAEGLAGHFDLIHLDPPFGSGAEYARVRSLRLADGRELDLKLPAYGDDDGGDLAGYLDGLEPVLHRCRELLSPRGSFWLHLDFRRGPYVRVLLDEVFGADNFVNEVIWSYGLGGSSAKRFQRKHDVLYFYARDLAQHWFSPPLEAATSQRMRGEAKRATDVWRTPDQDDGATLERAWPDALLDKTLSNRDPERTGYPTQKPLALAARIVQSSLPPGGTLLDLMAGSGTVAVAALRLGRDAVLGDRSPIALDVARGRGQAAGAAVQLDAVEGEPFERLSGPAPVLIHNGHAHLQNFALATHDPVLAGCDGAELLGAWGVAVAGEQGWRTLAWWDGAAQRLRPEVPRSLALQGGAAPTVWLGVDVLGRGWWADVQG